MSLKRFVLIPCLTAGLLLGSVSVPATALADTTLTVTPQQSTIVARGNYSQGGVPGPGTPAFLTVSGPDNKILHIDQGKTDKDGQYKFEWTMPSSAPGGTYNVNVHIQGDIRTQTFTYSAAAGGDRINPVNVGPYRFTGELNAGAKQAVIYNSDTGLSVSASGGMAAATLNESRALNLLRSAETGTNYLTISVPNQESSTTVTVPGLIIAEMIRLWGQNAHLLVAAETGSYDLPLKAVNSLLLDSVRNTNGGSLSIIIKRADPAVANPLTWKLIDKKATELVPAVEFGVTANFGGSIIPIKDYGNQFVRYSIDLTGGTLNPERVPNALFLHPLSSELLPAPSRLYRDAVGHGKIVIARTGNGVYQPALGKRSFDDIRSFYLRDNIEKLAARTVISGKSANLYDPFGPITRAEFATLMVRALGLTDKEGTAPFLDVPRGEWYTDNVAIGSTLGLISGNSSTSFAPNDPITVEQMAALMARSLQYVKSTRPYVDTIRVLEQVSDQERISSWARDDVALAISTGILKNTRPLDPARNANRSESAEMLYNLLTYLQMI